jgi:hypothetical protein
LKFVYFPISGHWYNIGRFFRCRHGQAGKFLVFKLWLRFSGNSNQCCLRGRQTAGSNLCHQAKWSASKWNRPWIASTNVLIFT